MKIMKLIHKFGFHVCDRGNTVYYGLRQGDDQKCTYKCKICGKSFDYRPCLTTYYDMVFKHKHNIKTFWRLNYDQNLHR